MKVAIVGAGGLVGSEFERHLSSHHDVLSLTHPDLDITDSEAVSNVILNQRPELIINCAVLGVDACEVDPSLAWAVNVAGAENLAHAANAVDAELLHLSTNYVFDGERSRDSSYTVKDRPAPINTYGQTKLAGELAVSAVAERCFIVRTSWVFGVIVNGVNNFSNVNSGTAGVYVLRGPYNLSAFAGQTVRISSVAPGA